MGRFRTGRCQFRSKLILYVSFAEADVSFGETDVSFDRNWRQLRRNWHQFRSKLTLVKSNFMINFVARDQHQVTRWTGHVFHIPYMKSGTPNQFGTLWNKKFLFFHRFWLNLWNLMIFWCLKSGEKSMSWKNSTFPKVKVMSGRITKYELRTPRELETISKLAKYFFMV